MTYKQIFDLVERHQTTAEPNRCAESKRFYQIAKAMHKDGALIEADFYLRQSILPLITSRHSALYKSLQVIGETINSRRTSGE